MSQTVLVVDDSKTIRNVVSMALKVAPFDTVGAGSVQEALKAIGDDTAMVLMDYHLPEVSGYELCRRLKDHEQTAGIPIVMMAGSAHGFSEEKAHQAGADRIIPKPFNTDTLLDAVVAATGTSKKSLVKRSVSREPAEASATEDGSSPEPASAAESAVQPPEAPPSSSQSKDSQPSQVSPSGPPTAPGASSGSSAESTAGSPADSSSGSSGSSTPRFSPDTGSTSAANPLSTDEAGSEVTTNPSNAKGSSLSGSGVSHAEAPEPDTVPGEGAGDEQTFAGVSEEQLNERIRQEVKDVVREQLPKVLRKVMGEVFQKRVLPKLMEHAETQVNEAVDDALDEKIERQVRIQIEQLLEE
jgi:CheY-like chemotaxis protein